MKKFKLTMSVSVMCLAIAVLCFGVFSATNVTYNIGGTISYEVEDVFVNITTKVYTSNAQVDNADDLKLYANKFVNQTPTSLGEYSVTNLTEYNGKFDFNSLANELDSTNSFSPQDKINMVFCSNANAYSMYIVINIVNIADSTVYTHVNSFTNDMANIIGCTTDSDLRIFKSETSGQTIVLTYSLKDKKQSVESSNFSFSLAMRCTEPYSYGNLTKISESFFDGKYSSKLKSIVFTNNSADFDVKNATENDSVGTYTYSNNVTKNITAYVIPNGELFDCYIYAPVSLMYAPEDSYGYFSHWLYFSSDSIDKDSYNVYYNNYKLEIIDLSAFDTSKTKSMQGMFGGCTALKKIIGFEHLDTSKVKNMLGAFYGCASLEELNMLNISFTSITDKSKIMGLIGCNDEYLKKVLGSYSETITNSETIDDKIVALATVVNSLNIVKGGEARSMADFIYKTNIARIICPKNLGDLVIGTPTENPYTIEGTSETTSFLVAGKTLIRNS